MRLKLLAGMAVLGLTLSGGFARAADDEKDKDMDKGAIHGVLIDNMCGQKQMDKDPDKAEHAAAKMGKDCASKESCAASGYAVISGKKMMKLDDKGNEMAKKYIANEDNKSMRVVV